MTEQTRITLKSLNVSERFSEETTCFEANLYFDGVMVATASNDGMGGAILFMPTQKTKAMFDAAVEYALSLPPIPSGEDTEDAEENFLKMDLELLVFMMVDKMALEKKVRNAFNSDMRKGVVFIRDGQVLTVGVKNLKAITDRTKLHQQVRKHNGADITILAELPKEEAYRLYSAQIR